jgi:hypothetical protein
VGVVLFLFAGSPRFDVSNLFIVFSQMDTFDISKFVRHNLPIERPRIRKRYVKAYMHASWVVIKTEIPWEQK